MILYLNHFTSWTCQNFDRLVSSILDFGGLEMLKMTVHWELRPTKRRGLSRTVTLRNHLRTSLLRWWPSWALAECHIGHSMENQPFCLPFCCTKKLTRLIGGPSPFRVSSKIGAEADGFRGGVRWTTIGQPSGGQRTWVWWTLPFQSDGNRSGSASLGDGLDGSASHKSEPEPFCFDIALTNQLPCFATAEICSPSQKVWDWYWYSYHFILSLFWHQW